MRHRVRIAAAVAAFICMATPLAAQQQQFDVQAYKQFLQSNKDLTADQLRTIYPGGVFANSASAKIDIATALYGDSIDHHYKLTEYEKSLIAANGFMVTERLSDRSFGSAYLDIFVKDLPVFISTDAVLHAIHMSYDEILKYVETSTLIPKLGTALRNMHDGLPATKEYYKSEPRMTTPINDFDIYLTVARRLLGETSAPKFAENAGKVNELMAMIKAEQPGNYALFGEVPRMIDFSQFTPRGHYTESPELTKYFQSMMWLGRTEIYLLPPVGDQPKPTKEDMRRQTILAALIAQSPSRATMKLLTEIDDAIRSLVGESDNVTLDQVNKLLTEAGVSKPTDFYDDAVLENFQKTLEQKAFAYQRINSQIIMSNPYDPEQLRPASAFLLFGQRFIIDSYVLGSVVYDKIIHDGMKVKRMLPSSLDVLFALGNNAAAQLLEPELKQYHYGSNLAALRYLVDSYEPAFWSSSVYNGWLNAIRTLSPPEDRSGLPEFMQTAAWWQQKMNTQLASWAQLRHDNLLYAKQSYTGGITCSYPKGLVEPIPAFYEAIGAFAASSREKFNGIEFENEWQQKNIDRYFQRLGELADKLTVIARKELTHDGLSAEEEEFITKFLFQQNMCGVEIDGWYKDMFFGGHDAALKEDLVVADVHTAPTDEDGNMVGWVMHAGAGPINMAVVVCTPLGGKPVAYVGPVMSYYEHVSTNFKRLTDEEWKEAYKVEPSARPSWTNVYLAGKDGGPRTGEVVTLNTVAGVDDATAPAAGAMLALQSRPNPLTSTTTITFTIPPSLGGREAVLEIYDINGNLVSELLHRNLPATNYSVKWDGTAASGSLAPDGVYFYRLRVGEVQASGKMTIARGER